MTKKDAVLNLIQIGDAEIRRYAGLLTEAEHLAQGDPERWAPKDILAHMAAWKLHMAEVIAAGLHGEPPPDEQSDYNITNTWIFEHYRHSTWDEILALVDQAQREVLVQVGALSEADLSDLERFPSQEGRPLWRRLLSNSYQHPLAHIGEYYLLHNDIEYATQMRQTEARLVAALDDDPALQGIAIYNLACHYALSGDKEKAYENLAPAFRLNPGLKTYAQQDSDLVSLYGEDQFKALVA